MSATAEFNAIRPRLLTELLDNSVKTYPDRLAIDFVGRTWTYGELGDLVERTARGLQDQGLQPGDRFGLCLPNCPYFVVLYFAVLRVGGIVVNFNPLYTQHELDHQIRDSGTRMIAVPDLKEIHGKVQNVARAAGVDKIILCGMADMLPTLQAFGFTYLKRKDHAKLADPGLHISMHELLANSGNPSPVQQDPSDIAVLQYTGGTTGVPKGAMLTHANLAANSAQMVMHVGELRPELTRAFGVLPLFHVFALTTVLNFSVEIGAEMVLLPRFEMEQVLRTLHRKPPTQFFGVPTIFSALNALPDVKLPDLSTVRACISGGAPLPFDVRERFEKRMKAIVVEGYGLSESSPIIACNPIRGLVKDNSCGPQFPETSLEIRNPTEPFELMPAGELGEVCARGPQIMKGYWEKPVETESVFVEGALRTGDIGYLDKDGYLFLVDRIKDVILSGGYNVYPRVIEDAAYLHPAVKEAVAIGVPDPYRGQSAKLFVAPREGMELSIPELKTFLAGKINKIEMPKQIEIRESLPKTLIGKLSKKELIAEEAARTNTQNQHCNN